MTAEIKNKIRTFIDENIYLSKGKKISFTNADNIFKLGLVNSMFAMRLLRYIEKEFNFTVEKEDLNALNFSSIDNMIALLSKKVEM